MCQCLSKCSKRVHSCTERFFELWASLIVYASILPFLIALVVFGALASGFFQQETFAGPYDTFFENVISGDFDWDMAERSSYLR